MNSLQKIVLFILILISFGYTYFSFFSDKELNIGTSGFHQTRIKQNSSLNIQNEDEKISKKENLKNVKIYISDAKGNLRSVNRICDTSKEKSCFAFAINELIKAPTNWEKSKGFSSEIPTNTKILSLRETNDNIKIDLSSEFEQGGGTESTYTRIKQIIKTARSNTKLPVFLYINGRHAEVIGGEGIMIKQPLTEKSLDE